MEEDFIIPEETEFQRKIRIAIRYAIGIFLIILMLSFLIPSEISQSIAEGKKITNYVITYQNITITFDKSTYENIKSFYLRNQVAEIPFCLTGNIENNNYEVNSFYIPKTFLQTPISVTSIECNQDTIISMHTHPFRDCLLSEQDISSYNEYHQVNPKAIMAVMCDIDTFAFHR